MSSRQEDGSSLKEHLDSAKANPFAALSAVAQVEQAVEEEPPILPVAASYVWSYFIRLHSRRSQAGMGGFLALGYPEMMALEHLEQIKFEQWEIMLIEALDRKFLEVYQEQQEREQKKQQSKT